MAKRREREKEASFKLPPQVRGKDGFRVFPREPGWQPELGYTDPATPMKRKRGRPKGSKDKLKRKRRRSAIL